MPLESVIGWDPNSGAPGRQYFVSKWKMLISSPHSRVPGLLGLPPSVPHRSSGALLHSSLRGLVGSGCAVTVVPATLERESQATWI